MHVPLAPAAPRRSCGVVGAPAGHARVVGIYLRYDTADAGTVVPDPYGAGERDPAWVRAHYRGDPDLGGPGAAACRDVVRGAGPAQRAGADRGGPRGGRGRPVPPLLPADPA